MTETEDVIISVEPTDGMDVLSQQEITQLKQTTVMGLRIINILPMFHFLGKLKI